MNGSQMVSVALTSLGMVVLLTAMFPTNRIVQELPPGTVRSYWVSLRRLIGFFIAGYFAYLVLFAMKGDSSTLLVSLIFFIGACFVYFVCVLSRDTVQDVKRIIALETENITDPLMEIFNRRHLERRLEEELTRARRYGIPLSLLMIDIDHFKKVNDGYGHPTGDLVLKRIGGILKEIVRHIDVPARYGGEEASVLLPHTGDAEATLVAERIRTKVESTHFPIAGASSPGETIRCTVSIGVATNSPECTSSMQLFQLADKALYQAKQSGRNRSVTYRCGQTIPE